MTPAPPPRQALLTLRPRGLRLPVGRHWRLALFLDALWLSWAGGLVLARALPWMPLVQARRQAILDHWYGATAPTVPADYFIGLSTTTPTDTGGNFTEPVGNAYARVQKANTTANWSGATAADPTVKANANAITYAAATGSWGTITHAGWFTALTGGTPVDWAPLGTSQTIGSGTTASFATAALTTQLDAV